MKRNVVILTLILLVISNLSLQAQRTFRYGKHGRFDAAFDPGQCLLTITVRVAFTFANGSGNNVWPDDSAKTAWKNDFIRRTQDHWSGKYRLKPSRGANHIQGCEFVRIQVVITEVAAGAHFKIKVTKRKNHVTSSTGTDQNGDGVVKLDSRDLEERSRNRRTQTGAFHEFGHMIGLPDEPEHSSGSQMDQGDRVDPEHYDTFEKALEALTGTPVEPALP